MYERETKTWRGTHEVAEIPLSIGAQANQEGDSRTENIGPTAVMTVETGEASSKTDAARTTVQPVCLLSRYRRPATITGERTDA